MKNETLTSSDLKIDGQKFESQLVNALKVLLDEEPKSPVMILLLVMEIVVKLSRWSKLHFESIKRR